MRLTEIRIAGFGGQVKGLAAHDEVRLEAVFPTVEIYCAVRVGDAVAVADDG